MDEPQKAEKSTNPLYTEEARRERFRNTAERRTNRILEYIRLLGNTSNKSLYKYEQADIEKIFSTIDKRLVETKAKFKTSRTAKPFKLEQD